MRQFIGLVNSYTRACGASEEELEDLKLKNDDPLISAGYNTQEKYNCR